MSSFRLLHLRRFFEHRVRTLLALSGIAIGGALVVSVLGFIGTLDGSVDDFVGGLAGVADLEVVGVTNDGFDESLFFDLSEVEGVEVAAPMVRDTAVVDGTRFLLLGIDERAESLGTDLSEIQAEEFRDRIPADGTPGFFIGGPLAEELDVSEGETLEFFADGRTETLEIWGIVEGEASEFNQGRFGATLLPVVQRVLGKQGRLDSVFIVLADGANSDEVTRDLARVVGSSAAVVSPDQRIEQARLATRDVRSPMLMGAGIAVTVGAFLIYNTMAMVAAERRRELATLRALGGRRWRLLLAFLGEAAVLGLIGSAIGAAVGAVIATRMVDAVPSFVVSAVEVELAAHLPRYAVPVALVAGAGAAVLAALAPAWKATGVAPVESMRPEGALEDIEGVESIAWGPTLTGVALGAGGYLITVWGPTELAFIWVGVMMFGILVASYGLTSVLTAATSGITSLWGGTGRLAAASAERAPRRSWATGVAVVIATAMVVGQGGIFANVTESVQKVVGSLERIDFFVSANPQDVVSDQVHLPGDWGPELASIDGVEHVALNTFQFINYEGQKVLLQGLENTVQEAPSTVTLSDAELRDLEAGEAAVVSSRFTDLYGIDRGDSLVLPTPTGEVELDVIDSVEAFTWERGMVTLGRRVLVERFGNSNLSDYMLVLEGGADRDAVRAELEAFAAAAPVELFIASGSETLDAIGASIESAEALFGAMTSVVVGAAALAIFNALLISVVERRRELGIMRALGTSRRQLRRMVALEAAGLGFVGAISGSALGFLIHKAALVAIIDQSGFPIDHSLVFDPVLTAIAIGVGIAVAASLIPAVRAASVDVIEAIGYE